MAGNVQPTLELARPLCWATRAACSLKSGLALTPGSDPESASSYLRGLRLGGLVILFVARGGPRRGIGGGPVHHAGLNKLERLAGPSVPSSAAPYIWLDLTPRFLQRRAAPGHAPNSIRMHSPSKWRSLHAQNRL